MENFIRKCAAALVASVFLLEMGGMPALAEDRLSPEGSAPEPQRVNRKLEELKKLKQQNPAEFDRLVRERKQKMKQKLQELKEKDPEKFQEVKEKIRTNRQQYLKRLQQENPERFQNIMHEKMQKLEALKQSDPEKYQRFMEKHPRLAQRIQAGGRGPGTGRQKETELMRACVELMPDQTTINESSLVLRAQGGDLKSFSALVEIYQERAVSVAYSFLGNFEDARDLAQEAFIKAHEKISTFKAESRFYTWFYRILANLCKDFLRKKKVRRAISFFTGGREEEDREDAFARVPSPGKNAGAILVNEELGEKILKAMDGLPFQQKSVFALRYLEELSLSEIAESLKLSEGAVKAHLWQAGQKMKKSLGAYLQSEGRGPK